MRAQRSRRAAVGAGLVIALALAACSADGEGDDDSAQEPTEGLTEETLVPTVRLIGPSTAYALEQYEANTLTLGYWEELGISTEYETTPDWAGFTGAVAETDWHAASAGYTGTPFRIDPDELLSRPLLCQFGDGGSNYGDYCFEDYDEVVNAQKIAQDVEERRALVDRAQELQALDLPLVTSFFPAEGYIWNSDAFDNIVPAVGQGLDNFWNAIEAEPIGDDRVHRIGINGGLRSVNPTSAQDYTNDVPVHNLVFDTLAKTDPTGGVVEWAAESWEAVDDTTIEVVLRDDMTFHDGEPVTAEDVAFSYEYFKEWEVGLYVNFLEPLEEAEVVDDRTLRFHLSEPTATFTSVTMTVIAILPRHIWDGLVEREGLSNPSEWSEPNLVGSGPYRIASVSASEGVELDAFEEHFNPPAADGYQRRYFSDDQGIFRAMQSGALHFHQSGGIGPSPLEQAERESHLSVGSQEGITVRWMAFSFRDGSPFQDYHFREAIGHTYDWGTIVDAILRGQGDPGTGTIGPGNEFWHADLPFEEADGAYWRPFDLDRARQILADAGYRWDDQGRLHYPEDHEPQPHYNS